MIICFQATREAKKEIEFLLNTGNYSDMNEVINAGVANLALLQRKVGEGGALVLDLSETKGSTPAGDGVGAKTRSSITVPPLLSLPMYEHDAPPFVPLPHTEWSSGDHVPPEQWIFGQYNRLLPVKVACRGLANMLIHEPGGVKLDAVSKAVVDAASDLGDALREFEEAHEIKRDSALSTAFPARGKKADKSRLRFITQFIASKTKEGDLIGVPADLRLINYSSDRRDRIALTEPGWRFAYASNPILDGAEDAPTQKFTNEEVEILLSHVAASVAREDYAFRTVLSAIDRGYASPVALDREIAQLAAEEVSEGLASTQRSGVVSRMIDLGLVVRERDGTRVGYVVTSAGSDYLSEPKGSLEELS